MIFLQCALPAEARSFIDYYHLKQCEEKPFRVYRNDSMVLAVSGMGKANTSTVMGFVYGRYGISNSIWLNIGVCGAANAEVGQCFIVNKCTEAVTGESFYPPQLLSHPFRSGRLITVDTPEQKYMEDGLYDMEGYSFFQAATRFSTSELVHSIKIVSDNATTGISHIDKGFVLELLKPKVTEIDEFVNQLKELSASIENNSDIDTTMDIILSRWRFSVTQSNQLRNQLRRVQLLSDSEIDVLAGLEGMKSSREVISHLTTLADHLPIRF